MKRSLPVKKVLISLLISLALVVCVVPTSAFANAYELPNSATARSSSAELFATDKTSESLSEDKGSNPSSPSALSLSSQNAIPMVGSVASGINTALYIAEGDYSNAALSAVSMVPGVGTAVKGTALGLKVATTAAKYALKLIATAPKAFSALAASEKGITTSIGLLAGSKKAKAVYEVADDVVNASAQSIISSTKKASILREYPGQWLDASVSDIERAAKKGDSSAKKAYKLLTDSRFNKGDNRK